MNDVAAKIKSHFAVSDRDRHGKAFPSHSALQHMQAVQLLKVTSTELPMQLNWRYEYALD